MNPFKLYLSCIFSLVLLVENAQSRADVIDVHLFAGQSNAVGSGHVNFWNSGPTSNTAVLYSHNSGTDTYDVETWGPAQFRLTSNGAIRRWYGAEMTYSFGIDDQPNQAILKFARNATSLHSDWAPDGQVRQQFFSYVDQELQALVSLGHTVRITDMIWIQGEADANILENAEAYTDHLEEFVSAIRTRYSALDMVFKYNQAHVDLNRPFTEELRVAQANYLLRDSRAFMVNIDDLTLNNDSVHFTSATHQTLGFRFAAIPEPSSFLWTLTWLAMAAKRRRKAGSSNARFPWQPIVLAACRWSHLVPSKK